MPSPRRIACLVLCLALLAPVAAGEDEVDDAKLVVRFLDVGALTVGRLDYIPEAVGILTPDTYSDSVNPLFGTESEEPLLPYGTVDEVIEMLMQHVDPVTWQITEGADIRSTGERILVVRAARPVVDHVARFLAELEADALATVTLEIRAVPAPDGPRIPDLETLLAADGPSVTLSGVSGQRVVGFSGTQYAYLQDYTVEVACDSRIADPVVGVANLGLLVSARSVATPGTASLRSTLQIRLADLTAWREHVTEGDRLIELPSCSLVTLDTDVLLEPGAWHVAQGNVPGAPGGRWIFLVRASAARPPVATPPAGVLLDPTVAADTGPLVSRRFGIADLEEPVEARRGWGINLVPSNYAPPEPPELAEPSPLLPGEGIVDLIGEIVTPGSWKRDGTGIDYRNGMLFVTNTAKVLDRVDALLALLRRRHLWTIDVDATLVDVPTALGRRLLQPNGSVPYLLDDARRAALAGALADGTARADERVRVTCLAGGRNTVISGTEFNYVQDYDVEVAEKSAQADPVVLPCRTGVEVDLTPTLRSTEDAVDIALSVTRARGVDPVRQVSTPHGPIDAPALKVLRLRGNVLVPLGETAIVGAGGEEGRMLVLMLTPVRHPYGE